MVLIFLFFLVNRILCIYATLEMEYWCWAYPRISCMIYYPPELQFRVLEEAQLSPRASSFSNPSPFSLVRSLGTSLGRSPLVQELESL
ncbi:hypothetical protein Bca4012_079114 [Brassica carinata]|nr:unnamed protein product [Brassica napus]